jgi:uncharacterized membrane protein YfcA
MSLWLREPLLALAGLLAGIAGTAGGVASLVSYPALLAVGLHPLAANVTNSIALVGIWPGSALGSREELVGRWKWVRRWSLPMAVCAAAGAVLLLVTPAKTFGDIVPFLVLAAVAALLIEPVIQARRARRAIAGGPHRLILPLSLVPVGMYSGYFGAGSGVMLLTAVLLLVEPNLRQANALKNMLSGAGTLPTALVFVIFGPVHWGPAIPMGIGLFAGARIGPVVARALHPVVLRTVIAACGLVLAAQLGHLF